MTSTNLANGGVTTGPWGGVKAGGTSVLSRPVAADIAFEIAEARRHRDRGQEVSAGVYLANLSTWPFHALVQAAERIPESGSVAVTNQFYVEVLAEKFP